MTKKPSEATIVKKLTAGLRERGWLVFKIHGGPYQTMGLPDLIAINPSGVHVWIECKRPGGRPTPIQAYRMRELREHNASVVLVDDVAGGLEYILDVFK